MLRLHEHLDRIACSNIFLNEILLNIYSTFIPNKVKTIRARFVSTINFPNEDFVERGLVDFLKES